VTEAKRTLKQKAFHVAREYPVISFYLFVVFSVFIIYKSVILAEHHIDYELHGFGLFKALALAMAFSLARSYIWPTSSGTHC